MGLKVAMVTPHKVRCGIASYSRDLSGALASTGVDVFIVRLPRFGIKTPDIMRLVANSIPEEVDVIHVQEEYGLFKGLEGFFYGELKRKGKPVVTTMHAVGNWDLNQVICPASDVVVTHNEFCSRRLGHPNVIIPHGCAPAECMPKRESKESYGLRSRWAIIGYLGFISSYKNLEILIDAMTELPEAGLLIGGGWHVETGTGYIQRLKQWSLERLPGRVQWLGYVPDRDLPRAYGAMDLVVYPSRFSTESGALLTAISHGKAVVASNLPPFREKEERGAIAIFEDLEALKGQIAMLIGNQELRARLEEGARRYAEENRWEEVARRHRSLYEDVVSNF